MILMTNQLFGSDTQHSVERQMKYSSSETNNFEILRLECRFHGARNHR